MLNLIKNKKEVDAVKQILCFGDSNTWGLIPKTGGRYPWGVRWTSLLQEAVDKEEIRIIEEGLCGRTTIFHDKTRKGRRGIDLLPVLLESHAQLDGAVLMLGTNDCKYSYSATPEKIGEGIEQCLECLEQYVPADKILLISPIWLGKEVWREDMDPDFDHHSVEISKHLKIVYEGIAKKHGTAFLAASDYAQPSQEDQEHMTKEGHRNLYHAIYEKMREMDLWTTYKKAA